MFVNIDPVKSFLTSIISAFVGSWYNYFGFYISSFTLTSANIAFQHAAWTVAILAGIVSIVNGVRQWKNNKSKNDK